MVRGPVSRATWVSTRTKCPCLCRNTSQTERPFCGFPGLNHDSNKLQHETKPTPTHQQIQGSAPTTTILRVRRWALIDHQPTPSTNNLFPSFISGRRTRPRLDPTHASLGSAGVVSHFVADAKNFKELQHCFKNLSHPKIKVKGRLIVIVLLTLIAHRRVERLETGCSSSQVVSALPFVEYFNLGSQPFQKEI